MPIPTGNAKRSMKQFLWFAAVGAVGTIGHYVTLFTLVQSGWLPPVPASAVGALVGAFINYILNYKFTFRSNLEHVATLPKFVMVAVLAAVVNTLIMWLGVNQLSLNYVVVQLFATATVLLFNFALNKCWTFRIAAA